MLIHSLSDVFFSLTNAILISQACVVKFCAVLLKSTTLSDLKADL